MNLGWGEKTKLSPLQQSSNYGKPMNKIGMPNPFLPYPTAASCLLKGANLMRLTESNKKKNPLGLYPWITVNMPSAI